MHKVFGESSKLSRELKQELQLGPWLEDIRGKWTTYIDPVTMRLCKKISLGWKEFPVFQFSTRRKKYQLIQGRQCNELHEHLELATSYPYCGNLILESQSKYEREHRELTLEEIYNPYIYPEFNTIKLRLDAAKESPQIPLNDYRLPDDDKESIVEVIRNRTARAVTDGSFKDKRGTAAVKIYAGTRTAKSIIAVAWSPGQEHEQCAYWSKLVGINCGLAILKALVDQYDIKTGKNEIALDSTTAKDQSKDFCHPPHVSQPSADIL